MCKIFYLTILLLFCSSVYSQSEKTDYTPKVFKHHVYIHPLSLFFSTYGLGYEMLLQQKHGIIIEGSFSNSKRAEGFSGGLQYRRHKEGKMAGGFWGFFTRFSDISEGEMELPEGEDERVKYKFEATTFALGANFGKTWVWDQGVSLHYRLGYGFPIVSFDWIGEEPEDHEKFGRYTFHILSGLDLTLAFGYSF